MSSLMPWGSRHSIHSRSLSLSLFLFRGYLCQRISMIRIATRSLGPATLSKWEFVPGFVSPSLFSAPTYLVINLICVRDTHTHARTRSRCRHRCELLSSRKHAFPVYVVTALYAINFRPHAVPPIIVNVHMMKPLRAWLPSISAVCARSKISDTLFFCSSQTSFRNALPRHVNYSLLKRNVLNIISQCYIFCDINASLGEIDNIIIKSFSQFSNR